MKVVINKCYGGFSLSPQAVRRYAELKGRPCYFFRFDYEADLYAPVEVGEDMPMSGSMFLTAFDVPNPHEVVKPIRRPESPKASSAEHMAANDRYQAHNIPFRPDDRTDPDLIRVVEELGERADGACAKLAVVEIPDGVDWEISEYDGNESVEEKHRSWR